MKSKSEQRMDYILEGAGLGSWDWWLKNNEVNFDQRWCEMLGLDIKTTPQVLSTWESRVHPEDIKSCYDDIKKYLDGKTSHYENMHRMKHEDGHWVWILDRGRISEYDAEGNPIRFTGTHFNFTHYKKIIDGANQSLIETKNFLSSILSNVPGPVFSKDADGVYLFANREFAKVVGRSEAEMPGKTDFDIFPRELAESFLLHDAKVIASKNPVNYFEDVEIPDLGMRNFHTFKFPVFNSNGSLISITGMSFDVTDHVRAQKKLEIEKAKFLHSAKLASLGEMAAGIAHEINNPLAVIVGASALLTKSRIDEEKHRARVELINKSASRISKIVSGLKKFSRSSEKSNYKSENLLQIISEVLILVEPKAKTLSTPIFLEIPSELELFCDQVEMEQVFINLISNSLDAIKDLEDRWVKVVAFDEGEYLKIQVIDSGGGIEPHIMDKLFEPFFTSKPVGEGTGLGLSISKGILESHRAKIEIDGTHRNTCFEIRFPKGGPGVANLSA